MLRCLSTGLQDSNSSQSCSCPVVLCKSQHWPKQEYHCHSILDLNRLTTTLVFLLSRMSHLYAMPNQPYKFHFADRIPEHKTSPVTSQHQRRQKSTKKKGMFLPADLSGKTKAQVNSSMPYTPSPDPSRTLF